MKVILQENVEHLGEKGDVVEVRGGYFRNYLLPRKLAIFPTEKDLKEALQKMEEKKQIEEKKKLEKGNSAQKLSNLILKFGKKTKRSGEIYGLVTKDDILKRIMEERDVKLNKKQIGLDSSLDKIGKYKIMIKLGKELTQEIEVEIAKKE